MRRNLIAATVLLLFLGTTAHAQEINRPSEGWRYVAIGAGALAGAWVVNLLIVGAPAAVVAMGGAAAGPTPGAGWALGADPLVLGAGGASLSFANRGLLMIFGGAAGGYVGAWLYDG